MKIFRTILGLGLLVLLVVLAIGLIPFTTHLPPTAGEQYQTSNAISKTPVPQNPTIVFDESHTPEFGDTLASKFDTWSTDLQTQGYTVQAMSTWNWSRIMAADILVIGPHSAAFTAAEYDLLHEFVANGGGLLIIGNQGTAYDWDEVAANFGVNWVDDALADTDNYQSPNTYWIYWNRTSNFGNHPITSSVTSVETYYGGGFTRFPMGATPILITDADDNSLWYFGGGVASGIPAIVAFDYQYGLGRIVVHGDVSSFENSDYDTDGIECYYDEDNEMLARNIVDWLAHPTIPERVVVFDESHSPLVSVGSDPTSISVLFDESHAPPYIIDSDNDGIFGYEDDFSEYGDFAQVLEGAGFSVSNISSWNPGAINVNDVLVLANPATAYSSTELDVIQSYVRGGGSLFLMGDWADPLGPSWMKESLHDVARLFGADFYRGMINDSDDYLSYNYWVRFTGGNLATHPVFNGVGEVVTFAGTALNVTPPDAAVLIATDDDATAGWRYTPIGSPSPRNLPQTVAFSYGRGRVVITCESNPWFNVTGLPDMTYGNNSLFGINIIRWLGEAGYNIQQYYDAANRIREAGYGIKVMFDFNTSFFAGSDALILVDSQAAYSVAETSAIVDYVNVQGNSLFLIGEWGGVMGSIDELAEEWDIYFDVYNSAVIDTDNNTGVDQGQIHFGSDNMGIHPILAGVNDVLYLAGTGFGALPGAAVPLIRMDNDASAQWLNNSPAVQVPVMAALEPGRGRLVAIGDTSPWNRYIVVSPTFGDNKTISLDYFDNSLLLLNTIDWLTENREPMTTLTAPNGGETISGNFIVTWTWDDYDEDTLSAALYYSDDNGGSWNPIISGLATNSYSWDTSGLSDGDQYLMRVEVTDGFLNVLDESNAVFTVDNHGPSITNQDHTPTSPEPTDTVTISADITDVSGVENATCYYRVNSGTWQSAAMTHGTGDTYSVNIGSFADGDTVNYYIKSFDSSPSNFNTTSSTQSFTVTALPTTTPTTPTTTPFIPGFPLEAVAIGLLLSLGVIVFIRRRRTPT